MLKRIWGIIFIVLGVISFIYGGYRYYAVENFSNFADAFGFAGHGNGYFDQLIQSAYQESYIFLGVGILLALIGSFMVKTSGNNEKKEINGTNGRRRDDE